MVLRETLFPERHAPPWQKILVVASYALAIASLVLTIVFTLQYLDSRSDGKEAVENDALLKAASARNGLDDAIRSVEDRVADIVEKLESGDIPGLDGNSRDYYAPGGVQLAFDGIIASDPNIERLGVFYVPGPDGELLNPFLGQPPNAISSRSKGQDPFVYTDPPTPGRTGKDDTNRYHLPLNNGSNWTEPFTDPETGRVVAEFGMRFGPATATSGVQRGVIYADFAFDGVDNIVQWLSLRETGYGFLVSASGNYLAHFDDSYVADALDVDRIGDPQSSILRQAIERSIVGQRVVVDYPDELTGQDSLLVVESLPTGWSMGYVVFKGDVLFRTNETKQALMRMVPAIISLIFFLSLIWSGAYAGSWRGLWFTSGSLALAFIAGVGLIWFWHSTTPPQLESARVNLGQAIADQRAFFEQEFDSDDDFVDQLLLEAGTGIFLTSVEFETTEEISVSGVVWQTFRDRQRARLETSGEFTAPVFQQGIYFPDAVKGTGRISTGAGSRAYSQRRQGPNEQFGWNFSALFPTEFDFSRYPFDRETLSIRINSTDLGRAFLHVPDIKNYDDLSPTTLPGVQRGLEIDGWDLDRSFFSYSVRDYGTEFGQITAQGLDHSTELAFNLQISRSFVGPFISNMLPLIIIAMLLFVALTITTKMPHFVLAIAGRTRALGAGEIMDDGTIKHGGSPTYGLIATTAVLSYTVALFFAIVLAHARLRGQFPDAGILYIEWYYFVAYMAVLGVTINAILYAAHLGGGYIHFRENLIPRVSYWPMNTFFLFVVTWISFWGE